MNLSLPTPGSIYRNRRTGKQLRVVLVDDSCVTGHDCELTCTASGYMTSWSSTPEEFLDAHVPGDPDCYPSTANC